MDDFIVVEVLHFAFDINFQLNSNV